MSCRKGFSPFNLKSKEPEMGQLKNGTSGSLIIFGWSISSKDRIAAFLKPALHAYGETIAFRFAEYQLSHLHQKWGSCTSIGTLVSLVFSF